MDRNAVIGFILIAVLFVVWMIYTTPSPEDIQRQRQQQEEVQQTQQDAPTVPERDDVAGDVQISADTTETDRALARFGTWFSHRAEGKDITFTVETDNYEVIFTSRGGSIKRFTLEDYQTWDDKPLQLVDWARTSDYNVVFASSDGKFIDTKDLYFRFSAYP
jgi:YidC/Oxa1 family membrane protein insertase